MAPIPFGDGTLTIGEAGTEFDASCLVNGLRIEPSVDRGDSVKKLCGTEVPGIATYTAVMSGNIDIDPSEPDGLFKLSWANAGSIQPFTFTPNNEDGATASGNLVIDPMAFGADAYGDDLNSDVSWTINESITMTPTTGDPYVLTLGPVAASSGGGTVTATGATAGAPGSWTPAGSTPPASVSALQSSSITASPATAWDEGDYVQTGTAGTAGEAYWDGSAWAAGKAPAP